MKIKRLWINTYKNIKEQNIEFYLNDSNVHVLVGKNGSGKSNVLEALSSVFSSIYINPNSPEFAYEINNKEIEKESIRC